MNEGSTRWARAWAALLIGALCAWRGAGAESAALDPVTVQLKWRHQFQFAGYYAAVEKGFYRDAGLDVRLVESTLDTDPVAAVLEGRASFGVTGPDLLLRRSEGQPVVVLGVVFQHSAQVLLGRVDAGIDSVHDLVGKWVMMEKPAAELMAYLQREGIAKDALRLIPHEHTPEALVQGRVDAISAYEGDEAFLLEEAGVRSRTFSPREGGIDFYGDLFFTSEEQVARYPARVRAFREATLRGWRYSFDHEDEVIAMILDRYSTRHSRAHLAFEAAHMRRLVLPDIVEPGYMNSGRWTHIAQVYAEVGMLDPKFDLQGFLYEAQPPPPDLRRQYIALALAMGVVVLAFAITLLFHRINRRLRLAVAGHVRAEEALRAGEAKFRALTESMKDVVWTLDTETWRFLYVSPSVQKLRGFTAEEIMAEPFDAALTPEGAAQVRELVRPQAEACRAGELPPDRFFTEVVAQPRKDGTLVWTEVVTSYYLNASTGHVEVRGVTRDITERRQAEAALVLSGQRLQLAVETAGIGIWDWDIYRNTMEWDAQMYRFYGLQPQVDQPIGFQQWVEAVLPEDLPDQLRTLQGIAHNGGRSEREFRIRRADNGAIRHMQAAEVCVTDAAGRPVHVVGVNLDITPRKEAETALHRAQQLLQLVLDAIPLGVIWKDRELRYLGCNRRAARDAGLAEAREIIGSVDGELAWRVMADAYRADDRRVLDSGAALIDFEETIGQPDGSMLWVRTNKIPLRDANGAIIGVLGTYEDISPRKRLELEQLKLLAELSRSNTDLEQFAYVASHDLKSPLRAIDSLAGWLQEDLESVLTGDSCKHLKLLRQRTHRMERLLDDLLAYSRAGRVPDDIVQVDVARLVAEIVEMINPPAGFAVRLEPSAPVFATAVTPLRQVLTNLIANAIKHHDRRAGLIEIAVREAGEWFEFCVADDGPGIPPEFHERIFGMFQTLRPRDEVEGSGIGLALVRRIVARYGGKATVACREPRGSVFCFQWPRTISTDAPPS